MTDPRESPNERDAIERARRHFGPYVQAEAARQGILGNNTTVTLTTAQLSWLHDFRQQIDLDGRDDVTELALIARAVDREDVCQHRMTAARRSCVQMQAKLAQETPGGVISQHEFVATLTGLRRALDLIAAEHQPHRQAAAKSRQALGEFFAGPGGDPVRDDAARLFQAAEDDLRDQGDAA